VYRRYWWHYAEKRPALYAAIGGLDRVLVRARIADKHALVFVSRNQVLNEKLVTFASDSSSLFALLQCSLHECWARQHATTLRQDMMYNPSDCFETFPFPCDLLALESIGEHYYATRVGILAARQVGLTKLYNLFHDPACQAPDIQQLRDLHVEMDRAVAAAYNWNLDLGHGFHETKQGLRFTISPKARATVLDLLLALNHERHAAEEQAAPAPKRKTSKRAKRPAPEAPLLESV
jgi:hypothetical protein